MLNKEILANLKTRIKIHIPYKGCIVHHPCGTPFENILAFVAKLNLKFDLL